VAMPSRLALLLALPLTACSDASLGAAPLIGAGCVILTGTLMATLARMRAAPGSVSDPLPASPIPPLLEQLEAERERSRMLIDESHDLVCRYDLQGQVADLNLTGLRLLGRSDPPRQLTDFVDPRFLPLLLPSSGSRSERTRRLERTEVLVRGPGEREIWLSARVRPILENGQLVAAEVVADDVTDRKSAEHGVAKHARAVHALSRVVSADTTIESALEALARELDFDYVELWQVNERYDLLSVSALWHAGNALLSQAAELARRRTLAPGSGLPGRIWVLEAPLYVPDLDQSSLRRADLEIEEPFRSALAFPIRQWGRLCGVLVLLTVGRTASRTPPLELLDTLGSQIQQFAERKRADERLKQSEARIRTVLETTIDSVVTTDREGRILDFNRAAERMFGHARSDVLGRRVDDLIIPPDSRARHREGMQRHLTTGERRMLGHMETTALRADGSEVPVELAVTPSRLGSEPIFTAFLRDISDRKELERLKDELVSTVSHELRTPLASVRGFVELLLVREYTREEQHRFLTIIDHEIKRLTRLINDFLDLQRLESGERNYEIGEHDLCELIRGCVEIAAGSATRHSFQVELPQRALIVRLDPDRIRQVVMNLLSNAVKFSPDGGIVRVRACEQDDRAEVSVRDQGIGMSAEVVQKLFRKFYRADSSTTRSIEGTGLGLALVREIVTTHQGEIGVQSEPGSGSEFFFTLPIANPQPKDAPDPHG
jgi:PAS domain S-box-containing protein